MIKHVIFDLGNVLLNFKPRQFLKKYTNDSERIDQFIKKVTSSDKWLMLDRGLVPVSEIEDNLKEKYPEDIDLLDPFFKNWLEMLTPIKKNVKILYMLKQRGYSLYALSNFIKEAFEYVTQKYTFFELFDGMVISYRVKTIKPEEKIFSILIKRYNLSPKTCLYIDDTKRFIAVGESIGFNVIHYDSAVKLTDEFEIYGMLND
ncbi:MAG: HAD-superfamily hydrolase, subfamily IA, variant 3 [Promethearchaeota archaeon]|nr:MAG: HAD-superfamily hydrolase, subfamily IA, variant 3 [Candidatus Lokiarchaeota archaeon]